MTKQQEIEILKETIAKLGTDSYLGDWLASVSDEVERDVRNDILPDYTLTGANKRLEARRLAMDETIKTLRDQAEIKNAAIIADARKRASEVKNHAIRTINEALLTLGA